MPYDSLEYSDIPDDLEMYYLQEIMMSCMNQMSLTTTTVFPRRNQKRICLKMIKDDQAVERLRIDWSKNYKLALDYMYGNETEQISSHKRETPKKLLKYSQQKAKAEIFLQHMT